MNAGDIAQFFAPGVSEQISTIKKKPTFGSVMGIPGAVLNDITAPAESLIGGVFGNPLVSALLPIAASGYAAGATGDPNVGRQFTQDYNAMQAQQASQQRQALFAQVMQREFPNGPPLHDMDEMKRLAGMAGQILGHDSPQYEGLMGNLIELRNQNITQSTSQATQAAAASELEAEGTAEQFDIGPMVKTIRDVYKGTNESFGEMAEMVGKIEVGLASMLAGNPQGFNVAIQAFAKLNDPGSVVRNEERQAVLQFLPLWDKAISQMKTWKTGMPIPKIVTDAMEAARRVVRRRAEELTRDDEGDKGAYTRYLKIVKEYQRPGRSKLDADVVESVLLGGFVDPRAVLLRLGTPSGEGAPSGGEAGFRVETRDGREVLVDESGG